MLAKLLVRLILQTGFPRAFLIIIILFREAVTFY